MGARVGMTFVLTSPFQPQEGSLNVSDGGNVGLGVEPADRQLHTQGSNAAFGKDRDGNSGAFILTRTTEGDYDTVLKAYLVGLNASGGE